MQHLLRLGSRSNHNPLWSPLLLALSLQMASPSLAMPRMPGLQGPRTGGQVGSSLWQGQDTDRPKIKIVPWYQYS